MHQSIRLEAIPEVVTRDATVRRLLLALALLVGQAAAAFAQTGGSITVSPVEVTTGTDVTVTLAASGFFDLSEVRASQVGLRPNQGVSNLRITSATAQRMELSFQLSEDATPGTRTLFIKDRNDVTIVALDVFFKLNPRICRPACVSPIVCRDNRCFLPGDVCTPGCDRCENCIANRCVEKRCTPACNSNATPPEFCECGICVRQK